MTSKYAAFACAIIFASAPITARATTVFSQTFTPTSATLSDSTYFFQVADDFTLSATSTITNVVWQGFYFPTGFAPATDAFTIAIYQNSSGTVGPAISTFSVGNNVNRTATGQQFDQGVPYYAYDASLGGGLTLGAGTYWISIFNKTVFDVADEWHWATNVNLPGNDQASSDGINFASSVVTPPFIQTPLYFELEGNLDATPLPGALPLFVSGLGGLGLLGWRRKRKAAARVA